MPIQNEHVMKRVHIVWGFGHVTGVLYDTPTARKVLAALPIESESKRWGDEAYFETGITAELEPDARDVVEPGSICFWVEGNSIAIAWGPTPISKAGECRM
ncbi:MAG: cyclophilin-like fold protein, partial [Nitrospinota bacterium]|nr:cyclophilin-like fold protein [Nitrospinota bacterium]